MLVLADKHGAYLRNDIRHWFYALCHIAKISNNVIVVDQHIQKNKDIVRDMT